MSTTSTRVDWETPLAGTAPPPGPPLEEGNRVLEAISRQEGLRALLAFSNLHEQIQQRRPIASPGSDWDLSQTERFVLDEVLQLICDRIHALTQPDGIVIALAEGAAMVSRATAGPLGIRRGVYLNPGSAFLQECLESGKTLRCDDSETDNRLAFDFARQIGARSTVLIPLRGRNQRLGVLQVFSSTPWAFTDSDVRCFDLFVELVLAALKPEDQDRRFHWLSDVAGEVLHSQPSQLTQPAPVSQPVLSASSLLEPKAAASAKAIDIPEAVAEIRDPKTIAAPEPGDNVPVVEEVALEVVRAETHEPLAEEPGIVAGYPLSDASSLSKPPATFGAAPLSSSLSVKPEEGDEEDVEAAAEPRPAVLSWPKITVPASSRPGLSVVMGLVAVAALFSVGVWWGTQVHGKTQAAKFATATAASTIAASSASARPVSTFSSTAPAVSPASDNLLEPAAISAANAPAPIPETKLAALPKITGVRHWSSSMGSTVVIDMEDQVPYEVHRLMSPERIYFDLHDTGLAADLNGKSMDVGDAALTKVRVAQPVAGVTRIVLDTRDGSNFSVSMESNPYRLIVELRENVKSLATTRPAAPAPAAKAAPAPALADAMSAQPLPTKTGKFRIVLDAGHGGWDLGTVGRQGLLEKDLVLDVTRRLGKLLEGRLGSEVMFTRQEDEYLPLDQRADFANHAQADLFVSVHANYSSLATARGVETFYTNSFSAPGSKEQEKHSEGTVAHFTPVSLSASGLHEKIEESRHLAASVQRSLYAALAAKNSDIRDRGIKGASFVVLTGTTMPAILTEISFVSSPADEHNLQSEAYRQQIAEALYKGISRYQETAPRAKVAKLIGTAGQ